MFGVAAIDYLVKMDVADVQRRREDEERLEREREAEHRRREWESAQGDGGFVDRPGDATDVPVDDGEPDVGEGTTDPGPSTCGPIGFRMEKELDKARANREFKSIMEDIVEYLASLGGDYEVTVSVDYRGRCELSKEECRTLQENAKSLKASFRFEQ